MKKINISYWIFTSLFSAMMLFSAIPDIMIHPLAVQGMHKELGYPIYFIPFIGVAKLLGAAVILLPGLHRLKEWAYAGLFFDLIGATYSIISIGKPDWPFMALPIGLGIFSYVLFHKRIKQRAKHIASESSIYPVAA